MSEIRILGDVLLSEGIRMRADVFRFGDKGKSGHAVTVYRGQEGVHAVSGGGRTSGMPSNLSHLLKKFDVDQ